MLTSKNLLFAILLFATTSLQAITTKPIDDSIEIVIIDDSKVKENPNNSPNHVYEAVEVVPEYPGGVEALLNFVSRNLQYPQSAVMDGVQGRVIVRFVVTKDGSVGDAFVFKSVRHDLDAEAIRVVKLLRGFTPGLMDGRPVNVWYTMPITFKLQPDANADTSSRTIPPTDDTFDIIAVDSVAWHSMIDYAEKAMDENNINHAILYYKEAYQINPYNITPLSKILSLPAIRSNKNARVEIYDFAEEKLTGLVEMYGSHSGVVAPMEFVVSGLQSAAPEDFIAKTKLALIYSDLSDETTFPKMKKIVEEVIPIFKIKNPNFIGQIYKLVPLYLLKNKNDIKGAFEYLSPIAASLPHNKYSLDVFDMLAFCYEQTGDKVNAQKYSKLVESIEQAENASH